MRHTMFLFGEAEKGDLRTPIVCKSLPQLSDTLGNPPADSKGIFYAVQALLYKRDLIYFRVSEEGFSVGDYMHGIKILRNKELPHPIDVICLPGVGDTEIIESATHVCTLHNSILILDEKDLYDYLTH
jgi:hypothetical protein